MCVQNIVFRGQRVKGNCSSNPHLGVPIVVAEDRVQSFGQRKTR